MPLGEGANRMFPPGHGLFQDQLLTRRAEQVLPLCRLFEIGHGNGFGLAHTFPF